MHPTLENDAVGLTSGEAESALARHGANTIPEPRRPGALTRVAAQLRDPMIMLLLAAMALAVALGDLTDTAVIALVIVLNTTVGVVQELRAERALAALRQLSAPAARVLRDGAAVTLPAAEVVPGDVVLLEAGDIVPADGDLLSAHRLQVDEAALTGESVPVEKADGQVSAGTVVTRGRGAARVTRTGSDSALGRIAALIGAQRPRPTPLQRRLAALGRVLALTAVVLSALVAALGLLQGRPLAEVALTGISLAVAAVPESLPAVVTLALALGAHRMARRAAVVRALPAVETLGSVTVLAADKTGTLTQNRMQVERLWTPAGGEATATGSGYDPVGAVQGDGGRESRTDLLRDVVLCNDGDLLPPDGEGKWRPVGDPTEVALLVVAAKDGMAVADIRAAHPRVAEVPFDSTAKRMTTTHTTPDGGVLAVTKGAPEVLLAPEDPARAVVRRWAAAGYRVLAVTDQVGAAVPRLAGLVAITDPPRADAAEVVETFRAAGVHLLMITGDHPDTARAIAARVGIAAPDAEVTTGDDLGDGTDATQVYARIRPEQKLAVVEDWQRRGHIVAMTGDGVNDAPALRRADIGVAMGGDGTEVARQAADLVLTDDNLRTVAGAIEEGRRIHANVRTFLRYALAGGAAEIAVMLLGPLLGLAVPLLPAQILWINLVTHGLPGVAIGAEPANPGLMRRPPRPPGESILNGLWWRVGWTGALIAAATLAVGWWAADTGRPWQSMVFVCLGLAQLGVAVALRARGTRPRFLDLAVAGAAALHLAGVWFPPLAALLGTTPLTGSDVLAVTAVAAVPALVVAVTRRRG
ncbi:cation-translocating P-type ATPase [Actinokineospora iranica]|uniref:cation-translocating P-type ATPase n=1 Tax=Actinokineospora iranica TaxID=1271860 RepID=UPI0015875CCE|nr:cation-translocating P-type ATPase [Actinokineospora iranica]